MTTNNEALLWTYETTRDLALRRMTHERRDDLRALIALILKGLPFASRRKDRDRTLDLVARCLAGYAPDGDLEALLEILRRSLAAMATASPGDVLSDEAVRSRIIIAQSEARAREAARRAAEERLLAARFDEARGGAGREKAAALAATGPNTIPDTTTEAAPDAKTAEGSGRPPSPEQAFP